MYIFLNRALVSFLLYQNETLDDGEKQAELRELILTALDGSMVDLAQLSITGSSWQSGYFQSKIDYQMY